MFINKRFNYRKLFEIGIQVIKFSLVGLSNTIICYIVYAVCVHIGIHYLLSNAIGFLISVINAFYWNNKYVFKMQDKEKRNWWYALLKCVIAYSFNSLALASVLLYIWIDIFEISPYIGQILNLTITIPLNFILNKFWAFK